MKKKNNKKYLPPSAISQLVIKKYKKKKHLTTVFNLANPSDNGILTPPSVAFHCLGFFPGFNCGVYQIITRSEC